MGCDHGATIYKVRVVRSQDSSRIRISATLTTTRFWPKFDRLVLLPRWSDGEISLGVLMARMRGFQHRRNHCDRRSESGDPTGKLVGFVVGIHLWMVESIESLGSPGFGLVYLYPTKFWKFPLHP